MRTSAFVSGLAAYVLDSALDLRQEGLASRCGAIRTDAVNTRTTLLLVRIRFDIVTKRGSSISTQLAEDAVLLSFEGVPAEARWLDEDAAHALVAAEPSGAVPDPVGTVASVLDGFDLLTAALDDVARARGETLLESHERVRQASRAAGVTYAVEPKLPVDVLGAYVFLPTPKPA